MAGAQDVKRRIRSVENTRKITRTMELVATSKLKRASDRVKAALPYSDSLNELVRSLYAPELAEDYPLLRRPAGTERAAVLLLTANRGLCGGFNANLIKEARLKIDALEEQGVNVELHISGKKGLAFFRFRNREVASSTTDVGDQPTPDDAEALVGHLRDRFEAGELDAVFVISSEFRSAMSTPPRTTQLLPIEAPEGGRSLDSFILSPSAGEIIEQLLPQYLQNSVYRALVENAAGEQGARRAAMKSATDNAGDVLENLRRSFNRARQAKITQEIAEIVGGSAALE
ncbi:MAG: ATP synthase F1 subunit gamma [Longimicrobiales bacterium]